jgi:hypothetical protein
MAPGEAFIDLELSKNTSRRTDGWSAVNQRAFLEAIAEGHGVDAACARVHLSATSAYAFRRTAKGAAFALGWRAASLVAREVVAETLLVRALAGQTDTYTRADGTTVTRHRHDNRLAMSLLARLDRQVEAASDSDARAARRVAQEFDAYLDILGQDGAAVHAGLFLARRSGALDPAGGDAADLAPLHALAAADRFARTGHATAGEVPVDDLDLARRGRWTVDQWTRADAAGLIAFAPPSPRSPPADTVPASQHSQHSSGSAPVWWDDEFFEWRTVFPPPGGFDGVEYGDPASPDYERSLTEAEEAAMGDPPYDDDGADDDAETLAQLAIERDAWFAAARAVASAPEPSRSGDVACAPPITWGSRDMSIFDAV